MPIFMLFVSAEVLFDGTFSLWVPLSYLRQFKNLKDLVVQEKQKRLTSETKQVIWQQVKRSTLTQLENFTINTMKLHQVELPCRCSKVWNHYIACHLVIRKSKVVYMINITHQSRLKVLQKLFYSKRDISVTLIEVVFKLIKVQC